MRTENFKQEVELVYHVRVHQQRLARQRVRDRTHQASGELVLFTYLNVLSFVCSMPCVD